MSFQGVEPPTMRPSNSDWRTQQSNITSRRSWSSRRIPVACLLLLLIDPSTYHTLACLSDARWIKMQRIMTILHFHAKVDTERCTSHRTKNCVRILTPNPKVSTRRWREKLYKSRACHQSKNRKDKNELRLRTNINFQKRWRSVTHTTYP